MPASAINGLPEAGDTGCCVLAYEVFHLGPCGLDWVEIGAIRRQEENGRASTFDKFADLLVLVSVEIVHANDVAGAQHGYQLVLNETTKLPRPNAAADRRSRDEAFEADGTNDGNVPTTCVALFGPPKRAPLFAPAAQRSNTRMTAGFINEDQIFNVE